MEVDSGAVSCLVGSVGGCRVDETRLMSSAGLVLLGGAGLVLLGNRGGGGGVGWWGKRVETSGCRWLWWWGWWVSAKIERNGVVDFGCHWVEEDSCCQRELLRAGASAVSCHVRGEEGCWLYGWWKPRERAVILVENGRMEQRGGDTLGLVLAWLTLVWWLVYRDSGLWAVMVKCEVMAGDD